ncbi:MAG: zinc-dependent alcohol dehydrogenase family protein [Steroidobacteraceae bacterium]
MTVRLLSHGCFGAPLDVLSLLSEPSRAPGAGAVRIAVEAAPIHAGDLTNIAGGRLMYRHVRDGRDLQVALPQVPGIEGVGRIAEIGAGVSGLAVGQRVLLPRQCGSWRSELVADAGSVIPLPEGDPAQLCLMVNAFTAELALQDLAVLRQGDWFVQNGANSNVGRNLIRLARRRGVRTINVVRQAALVPELLALGADVVVVDGAELAQRVRAAVGDAALNIALDGIGGSASGRLAECLSDGGTLAHMGAVSGEPCCVPTWMLLYKRLRVVGYYAGFSLDARPLPERERLLRQLAGLISMGELQTPIAGEYPLERWREAIEHAASTGDARAGKVVFRIHHPGVP